MRLPTLSWIPVVPGQLNTTANPFMLPAGSLSAASNLSRDKGDWRLCDRWRRWGNSVSEPSGAAVAGAGFGSFTSSSECERVFMVYTDGADQKWVKASLSASTGAAGNNWSSVIGTRTTSSLGWTSWQHLDKQFFAGSADNVLYSVSVPCGTSALAQVYEVAPFASSQATLTVADYEAEAFPIWGADAGAGATVRYTDATEIITFTDGDDDLTLATNTLRVNKDGNVSVMTNDCAYIYQTPKDFSGCLQVYVEWNSDGIDFKMDDGGVNDADFKVYFQEDGEVTWHEATQSQIDRTAGTTKVWCDLSQISRSIRANIGKVRFAAKGTGAGAGYVGDLDITMQIGGQNYLYQGATSETFNSATYPERNLRYYVKFRTADGVESQAIPLAVNYISHQGIAADNNFPLMGATVSIEVDAATSPFDGTSFIDIYRVVEDQVSGTSRVYRIVDGQANTGTYTFEDTYNDYDIIHGGFTSVEAGAFSQDGIWLGGTDAVASVSTGASWKGSNVLFTRDGKAYFSRIGTYDQWLWPGSYYELDQNDIGRPRTLTVTPNGLPIIAAVPADSLYMFTADSAYAMPGPTPALSDGPSVIPKTYGALGVRAATEFYGGALVATSMGLYWLRVPHSGTGVAEGVQYEELTKDIRDSWTWLIATGSNEVVVASRAENIWVFCESRFLHRSREGFWTTGSWADSTQVFDAKGHHKYGVILVTKTGRLGVLGRYTTDGSILADGTGGTAVTWSATTGVFSADMRALQAKVFVESPGAGTAITLSAVTQYGGTDSISFSGSSTVIQRPFPSYDIPPSGHWFKVTLSGAAADVVNRLEIGVISTNERRYR